MGRNWAGIAKALSKTHRVLTLDLRNHGASPWADAMTYPLMAADVAHLIETEFAGGVSVVGHSMGGKTAMALACERPNLVRRLAVVDIAPGPYDHAFDDHLDAMLRMNTADLARRADAETILADAINDQQVAQFLSRNLKPADGGGFTWQINVQAISANMDDITDFPVFEADQAYEGPTMFLSGGASDYVQPFHMSEIDRLFPDARTEVISGAGHWVHAEKPAEVTAALRTFLDG